MEDYDYLAGEIQNIQSELETQFGDAGITTLRLKRLEETLAAFFRALPKGDHSASADALFALHRPLKA